MADCSILFLRCGLSPTATLRNCFKLVRSWSKPVSGIDVSHFYISLVRVLTVMDLFFRVKNVG